MGMTFQISIDLNRIAAAEPVFTPEAVGKAMEHVRGVSAEQAPVDTGRLVGSAEVSVEGDTASLSYRGPYARYQHERLDLRHEHGNAKYLEGPLLAEAERCKQIIATEIRRAL